jgi:hypothetical protein
MTKSKSTKELLEKSLGAFLSGLNHSEDRQPCPLNFKIREGAIILIEERCIAPYLLEDWPFAKIIAAEQEKLQLYKWVPESCSWSPADLAEWPSWMEDLIDVISEINNGCI